MEIEPEENGCFFELSFPNALLKKALGFDLLEGDSSFIFLSVDII